MKRRNQKVMESLTVCVLALFICNCQGNEDAEITKQVLSEEEILDAQDAAPTYAVEVATTTQPQTMPEALPEAMPIASELAATSIAPAAVLEPHHLDPLLYSQDIFATDDLGVEPWRANYVGSYGLLPTRFQDKGPFLYSFDVSPEAARSPDNNLGPLDFFDHGGDDDDF